jgi:hypothetical protein
LFRGGKTPSCKYEPGRKLGLGLQVAAKRLSGPPARVPASSSSSQTVPLRSRPHPRLPDGAGASNSNRHRHPSTAARLARRLLERFTSQPNQRPGQSETAPPLPIAAALCPLPYRAPASETFRRALGARAWSGGHGCGEDQIHRAIHHPQVPGTAPVLLASNISARSSLITYCCSCSDLPRPPAFAEHLGRRLGSPPQHNQGRRQGKVRTPGCYSLDSYACVVSSPYLCLLRIRLGTATVLSSLF